MNHSPLLILFFFWTGGVLWPLTGAGQNTGIGTTTPHPSAKLQVTDTTRGVLINRLTLSQRDSISSPANGLLIYQTDTLSGFYYYNTLTSQWTKLYDTLHTSPALTGKGKPASPLRIAPQGANTGEVLKWNGTTWTPMADNYDPDSLVDNCNGCLSIGSEVTGVSTTNRISGTGAPGSPLDLAQQGASGGQVLKWDNTANAWLPAKDDTGTVNDRWVNTSGDTMRGTLDMDQNDITNVRKIAPQFFKLPVGKDAWSSGPPGAMWVEGKCIHFIDANGKEQSLCSNTPPDAPVNISPPDGDTTDLSCKTLSAVVSDPDGDTMEVTFYDAAGSQIGTVQSDSGDTATITWCGFNTGTKYAWSATASDGEASTQGPTRNFITRWPYACGEKNSETDSNGEYKVDPDGPGGAPPFYVRCEQMSTNNAANRIQLWDL